MCLVAYYKDGKDGFYFDSYIQVFLQEVADYLKTETEKQNDEAVIARNTDIVQKFSTKICGHQCLYVLKSFSIGESKREILDFLLHGPILWQMNFTNQSDINFRKDLSLFEM